MANSKMFAGRAPQARGGIVELKDGRWMMVWSGLSWPRHRKIVIRQIAWLYE